MSTTHRSKKHKQGFRSLPFVLTETGERVKLSHYWREQDAVIEFGYDPLCNLRYRTLPELAVYLRQYGPSYFLMWTNHFQFLSR